MACRPLPEQGLLLKLLRYEPETGDLFWRARDSDTQSAVGVAWPVDNWNAKFAGSRAFNSVSATGYLCGRMPGDGWFSAHRIVWKMIHGVDPRVIDHIDGDRANNRIVNLRSVTAAENSKNLHVAHSTSRVGYGARSQHGGTRFGAFIKIEGKDRWLGSYRTREEALEVSKRAQIAAGYHQNHGVRRANWAEARRQAMIDMAEEGLAVY